MAHLASDLLLLDVFKSYYMHQSFISVVNTTWTPGGRAGRRAGGRAAVHKSHRWEKGTWTEAVYKAAVEIFKANLAKYNVAKLHVATA